MAAAFPTPFAAGYSNRFSPPSKWARARGWACGSAIRSCVNMAARSTSTIHRAAARASRCDCRGPRRRMSRGDKMSRETFSYAPGRGGVWQRAPLFPLRARMMWRHPRAWELSGLRRRYVGRAREKGESALFIYCVYRKYHVTSLMVINFKKDVLMAFVSSSAIALPGADSFPPDHRAH